MITRVHQETWAGVHEVEEVVTIALNVSLHSLGEVNKILQTSFFGVFSVSNLYAALVNLKTLKSNHKIEALYFDLRELHL